MQHPSMPRKRADVAELPASAYLFNPKAFRKTSQPTAEANIISQDKVRDSVA